MPLPSIQITGNVVDDPSLRYTASGTAVVSFRVAANKSKKTEAGGWQTTDTCFLSISAWDRQAEAIVEEVVKGAKVVVTGQLKQRSWEKDGQTHYAYEVQAYDVALVVKARTADRERPSEPTADPWATGGQGQPQNDPWAQQPASDATPPF